MRRLACYFAIAQLRRSMPRDVERAATRRWLLVHLLHLAEGRS